MVNDERLALPTSIVSVWRSTIWTNRCDPGFWLLVIIQQENKLQISYCAFWYLIIISPRADRRGFEPRWLLHLTVFKTASISLSDIYPNCTLQHLNVRTVWLVASVGLEPTYWVPKTQVLPLDDNAILTTSGFKGASFPGELTSNCGKCWIRTNGTFVHIFSKDAG